MLEPIRTREQAEKYLAQIYKNHRQYQVLQFEFGWAASPILTNSEIAAGQGLGLTRLVIDSSTGLVFDYPSWPMRKVMDDYSEAKRTGRPPRARQVYPPLWLVEVDWLQEDPTEIQYMVFATTETQPVVHHQLIIDKRTLHYRTNASAIHPVCTRAAAWACANRSPDGIWPQRTKFEF
ncbi:hypothetical protein [Nocardia brasiliensis]|uniref:Uncharacterized protein n=1 Tax=Nocardia brasiliensis (strain ATCC 700358 / HUJEG-1) TaxID=1133849 RepID=K0EQS6_NOCB7|nr:hypothetical protein [Nocardia brasiliensis]AFT99881.1 hypothetical protein O3I_009605 [Nocardia brasiliensis ATCC 700358]OCF87388.1 hypothetical protein AW168_25785 [Nocardia brasiliensis]